MFLLLLLHGIASLSPVPDDSKLLESISSTLAWPATVDLDRQILGEHFSPAFTFNVNVLARKKNVISNADAFSDHKLDLVGYQWVYYNGYFKPSGVSAALAALKKFSEGTGVVGTAARDFWTGFMQERVRTNLQTTSGQTIRDGDMFLAHTKNDVSRDWWGDDVPNTAIVPRASNKNKAYHLHKDLEISGAALNRVSGLAELAGYELYNVWIALVDVTEAPLVINTGDEVPWATDADGGDGYNKQVTLSEMNQGDYVIFNTRTKLHAGADMEFDDEGLRGGSVRLSIDFRFFVKFT